MAGRSRRGAPTAPRRSWPPPGVPGRAPGVDPPRRPPSVAASRRAAGPRPAAKRTSGRTSTAIIMPAVSPPGRSRAGVVPGMASMPSVNSMNRTRASPGRPARSAWPKHHRDVTVVPQPGQILPVHQVVGVLLRDPAPRPRGRPGRVGGPPQPGGTPPPSRSREGQAGSGRADLLPVHYRERGDASRSSASSRSMVSTLGSCRPSMPAITSSCFRACPASGWAKMVRIAAGRWRSPPSSSRLA